MGSAEGGLTVVAAVVGDVMVDVVVYPIGSFNPGSDTRSHISVRPGGSAANLAVAMAAAARLGSPTRPGPGGNAVALEVHLAGAVGDDPLGVTAQRSLEAGGVATHLRTVAGVTTGTVVAVVSPDGERSMLTDRGANLHLRDGVPGLEVVARADHTHLSGYVLLDDTSRAAGTSVLGAARRGGARISIDACSAGPLAEMGPEHFLGLASGVDMLFANRQEAAVLTSQAEPLLMLDALRVHFTEVLLTLGPEGALYSGPSVAALAMPAATTGQVADTAGAGDALTGTFLARRLCGDGVFDALRAAMLAASSVVAKTGARAWQS
jgi:ribokinase